MKRFRPELIRGLAVLGIFLTVIIATDLMVPFAIKHSQYQTVSIDAIKENPERFEGLNVSTKATIVTISKNGSLLISEVEEEILLVFLNAPDSIQEGNAVYIRGISWVQHNNSLAVEEFYITNSTSSLIRSIPGIGLFAILFLMLFSFNFRRLAFVKRRKSNA